MARPRSQSNPNPRRSRPPYTYTPLSSPRHIRLIRILTYDPVLSQLYITLTEHPIDSITHRFTALSYTWGSAIEPFDINPTPALAPSPDNVELIVVPPDAFKTFRRRDDLATTEGSLLDAYTPDLRSLPVTGNLSDFLRAYLAGFPHRHLRPRTADGGRLSFDQVAQLWVDAVCIDQGNADEKAAQIPLMGEVYSLSGRVLGWLGLDERRLAVFCWWHRVVFPAIRRFVHETGRAEGMLKLREGNFVNERFWREVVGFREEPMGGHWARAWADYWAFYRTRRYFHRVWIVQEVVVAGKFDTMAGMGGEELSWEVMTEFAYFLGHAGWIDGLNSLAGEMLSTEYTDAITRGFGITDISGMQEQHQSRTFDESGWAQHWWGALSAVRRRDCFVQQDKVFATVGILQQALPKGNPLPFPVNATVTPEEVYINAARTLLLNCPHLTLLSFVDHPFYRKLTDLPSWVPDLTIAKFPWPLGTFDTPFTAYILPSPTPPLRSTTPSGELHLRGFHLDTITTKTEYEAPMNIRLSETVLHFLASLPTHYAHVTFPAGDGTAEGQFREAALVHTMTCHEYTNVNRGTPDETGRVSASFRDWLLVALGQVYAGCLLRPGDAEYSPEWVAECEGRRAEIERVIGGLEPRVLVPDVEDLRAHGEEVARAKRGEGPWPEVVVSPQEFKDQVRRLMLYRCLFRTADEWMGVCLETCEVGDEVWLLEGGAVPYVLRRRQAEDGRVTFLFRGECYVHGATNGELMKKGYVEGQLLEDVVLV
ncbi:heterokaryon incompatibility protein-domain-containing protein [Chaetomium sp. MPI-CAGE-AT-0009]|nr:heterokaryon incompatibility protein-domain-containing protein [Chaetomium sp. MPI-CAGE-AT-0009]